MAKAKIDPVISNRSKNVIERLISDAGDNAWQQDQGTGSGVELAQQAFTKSRRDAYLHVRRLESRIAELEAQLKGSV